LIEQVRKGGLPPLFAEELDLAAGGGKPPFLTCSIAFIFRTDDA